MEFLSNDMQWEAFLMHIFQWYLFFFLFGLSLHYWDPPRRLNNETFPLKSMYSGWTNVEQLDQLMLSFSLAGELTERETLVIFFFILCRKQNQTVLGFIWQQVEGGLKNPTVSIWMQNAFSSLNFYSRFGQQCFCPPVSFKAIINILCLLVASLKFHFFSSCLNWPEEIIYKLNNCFKSSSKNSWVFFSVSLFLKWSFSCILLW